jgi:hypothetical protein
MFGSGLTMLRPPDLDLLLVYQDGRIGDALQFRGRLLTSAQTAGWPPLDFVTLSASEEAAVSFARVERARLVA